MALPAAYLITFSTYGTWLHGDPRGSVDCEHNVFGTPYLVVNQRRAGWERDRLRNRPVWLDDRCRAIVRQAVVEVCSYRGWTLHELNVRTNHVHAVVTADVRPERVLNDLKARATRALRTARVHGPECSPWTDGGSTRYLWTPQQVRAACHYVLDCQGPDL